MNKLDLIIDTSGEELRLILSDKNVIHSFKGDAHLKFQEHLLPELDKLLKKNSITLSDVGSFCVVVGPGSFTGVRLGVTMVKAFSYVDKTKKIISINMLELLMDKISKTFMGDFLVVIKCTTSKMYVGESVQGKYSFKVLTNEEICNLDQKIFSYGIQSVQGKVFEEITLTDEDYVTFIQNKKKNKEFVDLFSLEPIYMALSQAEEELLKKETHD